MRAFSSEELSRMQSTQEDAMQDTCVLLTRSEASTDEYNLPVVEWTESDPISCGLGFESPDREEGMDLAEVAMAEPKLRLPIDTDITNVDRVRMTYRFGVALDTALTFELVGNPTRGPSGLVVQLKAVTDGSG